MTKYLVIDEQKNLEGDVFVYVYDSADDANTAALVAWRHLTASEQRKRHIFVACVALEDLEEYAVDEETGEIDWTCYKFYHSLDNAFDSEKIEADDEDAG